MGNLWDSFVSGYNDAGPESANGVSPWENLMGGVTREQAEAAPKRPASPWDKLVGMKTHEAGDGFYGREEGSTKAQPDYIRAGLIERGLPEHVAEGFVMNMKDESGFDAGINEKAPLVKGSRGGFGLYQLTGPRRREYEAFAQERGVPYSDVDAQLDFLVKELETTEASAAQDIFRTNTAGEAGAAIVTRFLRPAESHRHSRASKYLGRDANSAPPRPNRLWLDF